MLEIKVEFDAKYGQRAGNVDVVTWIQSWYIILLFVQVSMVWADRLELGR